MRLTHLGLPAEIRQHPGGHALLRLSVGILPQLESHASRVSFDHLSNEDVVLDPLPEVEVRPSPGKRFGLFAADDIPAYTRILEDDALLSLAQGEDLPQLWEKYCALPTELKQKFDELSFPSQLAAKESLMISKLERRGYTASEAQNMARVNSRWQANAFKTSTANIGSPGSHKWAYSLFVTVARVNHSCTPNACTHYRPSGAQVMYAVRDIAAGEEIEIAYFDLTMNLSDRQTRATAWGFECSCPACAKTGHTAGTEYEQRLSDVRKSLSTEHTVLEAGFLIDSTQNAISIAHSSEYPWLVIALPKLYLTLYNLLVKTKGRETKQREILQKVLEWEEKITGTDSPASVGRRRTLLDVWDVEKRAQGPA